jgi:Ca2+-binding EF-hand superfamily protein
MIAEFDTEQTHTISFEGFLGTSCKSPSVISTLNLALPSEFTLSDTESTSLCRSATVSNETSSVLTCGVRPCADMLASHTADIDVDKEMIAAFGEYDTARDGRLDRATFHQILTGSAPNDNNEEHEV